MFRTFTAMILSTAVVLAAMPAEAQSQRRTQPQASSQAGTCPIPAKKVCECRARVARTGGGASAWSACTGAPIGSCNHVRC
jgi:hypothetical protein